MGRGDRLVRWTTTTSVMLLAAIAAIVSYRHMHTLVVRHGETPWTAAVLPLSVDGMIAASSMALLADSRNGRRSGIFAMGLAGRRQRRKPRRQHCRRRTHTRRPVDRRLAVLRFDRLI